jgi:EAL domain-containing protein (putative c-di-GMP-specific phosphodiesterase class I)
VPANTHGLTIVARGIETPEQFDTARAAGCHLFQGFQIAPPLEPNDASEILRVGLFAGSLAGS